MKLLFKCDDCRHVTTKKNLKDLGDLDVDLLSPGTIIPTGRCPQPGCEANCFPLVLDLASRNVLQGIHALWDALSDILEEPSELNPTHRRAGRKSIKRMRTLLDPHLIDGR